MPLPLSFLEHLGRLSGQSTIEPLIVHDLPWEEADAEMKLEFYTHPKMDKWQHAYIKWVEENRWFNLHERMITFLDCIRGVVARVLGEFKNSAAPLSVNQYGQLF